MNLAIILTREETIPFEECEEPGSAEVMAKISILRAQHGYTTPVIGKDEAHRLYDLCI